MWKDVKEEEKNPIRRRGVGTERSRFEVIQHKVMTRPLTARTAWAAAVCMGAASSALIAYKPTVYNTQNTLSDKYTDKRCVLT